jgi:hypothetical protein
MPDINWINWLGLAALGANLVMIGVNTVNMRRYDRLMRRAVEYEQHAMMLDDTLQRLCLAACRDQTNSVWSAWAQTMGTIKVQIMGQRTPWDAED